MTLLLLAGTGEAREIARGLATAGIPAMATLAGVTRHAASLGIDTVSGGFGGEIGFRTFLQANSITAIIDATHPFAAKISHRTARIAAEENVRYLQVLRPKWEKTTQDRWISVRSEAEAVSHIDPQSTVFLATGRQRLSEFSGLAGQTTYCRQIDPPSGPFPFEGGSFLVGRPPFSVDQEEALFAKLGIDILVVKNAGGQASQTKLIAARKLGITVLMIERPEQPLAERVETAREALLWAQA